MLETLGVFEIEATEEHSEHLSPSEAADAPRSMFEVGTPWGRPWHSRWFRLQAEPSTAVGGPATLLVAHLDLGFNDASAGFQAEGLLWEDGQIIHSVQPDRRVAQITPPVSGTSVELWLEATANPSLLEDFRPTSLGVPEPESAESLYVLRTAELALRHTPVHALIVELEAVIDAMTVANASFRAAAELALEAVVQAIDLDHVVATAPLGRAALAPLLARTGAPKRHRIMAAGHAHLDTAWLWPMAETKRKFVRTVANALDLLDRFPQHSFSASQAQHYQWLADGQPELFDAVVKAAADGRWEPVGGMWVEADLNLPSGESLVRQFLHGQRAFAGWFGQPCTGAFLPDDFGFPASFPQLAKLAGCSWLFTNKLSWNETNRIPHDTFRWRGIDGSEVLTHLSPIENYNAKLLPSELHFAEANFLDHGRLSSSLAMFGHGDGGGGPTEEMLLRADLARDWEPLPRVTIGTVSQFFGAQLEVENHPEWHGELYFERHRGTLTTQRKTKAGNRRAELALHDAELWTTTFGEDRSAELGTVWREVLTQQFHDVLPGTSIAWAHDDAERTFTDAVDTCEELTASLLTESDGLPELVNSAPVPIDGVVLASDELTWARIEPFGSSPVKPTDAPPSGVAPVVVEGRSMRNGRLEMTWDEQCHVTSLVHRESGRDLLADGQRANVLSLRRDFPGAFDAWDIDQADTEGPGLELLDVNRVAVVEATPLRATLEFERWSGNSRFVQTLSLAAGADLVEATVRADWQESECRLQLVWPMDIHTSTATCGIQFGHVTRARHENTSWDAARFEVCGHRYVHLGEHGFGAALLADGPHGFDLRGDGLRMSLLRSSSFPDPEADRGEHVMSYAIWVHAGDPFEEGLEEVAHRRAHPPRLARRVTSIEPAVAWEIPGVVVSAIKHTEDQSGDLIVRLWETRGGRTEGVLSFRDEWAAVTEVDGMEERISEPRSPIAQSIDLTLQPFQVLTLRLRRP